MPGSTCHAGTVSDESELGGTDAVCSAPWALDRDRLEHSRAAARARYRDHLATVLARHDVAGPATLADVVLDALTVWRYPDTGALCRCSCHPRLPDSDLHDYGFDCPCTHSAEHRRRTVQTWRADVEAFRKSAEGQRIAAADQAAANDLGDWLATQPGVQMRRLCGVAPEHWSGHVDGHRFDFRERHEQWDIEIAHQPDRESVQDKGNTDADITIAHAGRKFYAAEVIACGTIDVAGYGTTPVERAQFLADTIRIHLARKTCHHHLDLLVSLESILGTPVRWCPICGRRLDPQHRGSAS